MAQVLDNAKDNLNLSHEQIDELRLAALLHDIGHYPYSHLMEGIDDVILTETFLGHGTTSESRTLEPAEGDRYPKHEELGELIVTKQADVRKALGGKTRAGRIAELFTRSGAAPDQISKLIHSSGDMDRIDYLIRDSRFAGVPYGAIDLNYLLQNVRTSPNGMIGIDYKAMAAAEQFLLARFFMYKTVYFHKTTYGLEEAFRQLVRRCREKGEYDVPRNGMEIRAIVGDSNRLLEFTDSYLDRVAYKAISNADRTIQTLGRAVVYRRPPKLLHEVCSMVNESNAESMSHNRCTSFLNRCKTELGRLAKTHRIPPGLFLVAQPKSIRIEKRGPLMTRDQASEQPSESKDELIKVFLKNDPEPRSLVDISESILHACANRTFRIVRLYVVEQNESKVDKMKRKVERWGE
jgi:hypothetical protein